MNSLLNSCISYIKNNINKLLTSSFELDKFYSLDDELLSKLAEKFSNRDTEILMSIIENEEQDDMKERLESIFYGNLIISLTLPEPEIYKGHYSSLCNVYKCKYCKKVILPKLSEQIHCVNSYITMNRNGDIIRLHETDNDWNLTKYVDMMKDEFKNDLRRIYWRVWSECHYLYCDNCNLYYSIGDFDKCHYHPDKPVFHTFDMYDNLNKSSPVGQYRCCGEKVYMYNCVKLLGNGCKSRLHVPSFNYNNTTDILNIFETFKSVILDDNDLLCNNTIKLEDDKNVKSINSQDCLRLFLTNKNVRKKGLIGNLSDKLRNAQKEILKKFQMEENTIPQRCNDNEIISEKLNFMAELKTQLHSTGLINKKRKPVKSFKSGNAVPDKLKTTHYGDYEKLIKTIEGTRSYKDKYKNITNKHGFKDVIVDETQFYSEGCCLPLKDINTDERYFNKPIQYTKRAQKHKKSKCGLQSKLWHNQFSIRYNQDKQRENEENCFLFINSWLTEKNDSINALTDEKIIDEYFMNSNDSTSKNHYDNNENTADESISTSFLTSSSSADSFDSKSCDSVSSYCSTINSAIRVHHSRTTTVWNSFVPLAGLFVRIESDWRELLDDELSSSDTQIKNKNNYNDRKNSGNILLSRFNSRLKARCKYPYYKNVQSQFHNRRSFKYKNQNTFMTMKKNTLEIPLTNYAEDYSKIWFYDRCSHELDYLSSTYMPIPNGKQYRHIHCDLQNEWDDMLSLEKSWSGFLKLFSENEMLPKNHNNNLMRYIQSYHSLYNLYMKIDFKNDEEETKRSKLTNEINSDDTEINNDDEFYHMTFSKNAENENN